MKQAAAQPTTKTSHADAFTVGAIAVTFLDTTWRIATPVLLFTIPGLIADRKLGTKPWLTLLGVVVGFVFAVLLVKRQLAAVQKAEDEK